jgi:cysteine desulfurase
MNSQTSSHSQNPRRVYFDNNATTPIASEIRENISVWLEAWGNPSSIHWAGRAPKNILRESHQRLAQGFNVHPLEIIFTSGGSESNNTILKTIFDVETQKNKKPFFITTTIEHPSVLKTLQHLESLGARLEVINISREGDFDWVTFEKLLLEKPSLVSVMYANNETGLILPIKKITEMAQAAGALVHTDAVQAMGKIPLDLQDLGVDYASFSAHKFYALKGTGILYCRRGSPLKPLILGGAQERFRRGGTENVLGLFAINEMAKNLETVLEKGETVRQLRDHFEKRLLEISGVSVTHKEGHRLANTSSVVIEGTDGETLLMSLDLKGFAVSTGAACSSGNPEPSPVLLAIGLSREEAQSSLRVSLGWQNTLEEVNALVEELKSIVDRLRKIKLAEKDRK